MPINAEYRGPGELPEIIPVFPLPGALLLPRGQMPLNIFEPRYLAMVDDALRDGHRLIGMIQPDVSHSQNEPRPALFSVGCVGRITQLAEAGDGRYILELTGISRFKVVEEITALTAYRQCKVDYFPFIDDFTARKGEEAVDREALLEVLTDFLKANNLKVDWEGVESAPNEALVNALAMMSPYGPPEKQAMLEAPDLKHRLLFRWAIGRHHRQRVDQRLVRRAFDPFPVDLEIVGFEKISQHLEQRFAVDRFFALARGEIVDVGEIIHLALPIRGQRGNLLDATEARDTGELQNVAAVAGLGELSDAPDAADAKQRRLVLVLRVGNVRLDHSDQPMGVAQSVVPHRQIARLEDVERHLTARQQQRAGQRKHRDHLGKVARPAIIGIDRHVRFRR